MMITTDKVTVNKGDKVWRIVGDEIERGEIANTDDYWTTVKWPNENYHKSFESYGHWDDKDGNTTFEVDEELFGNEVNAINVLIYRTVKAINEKRTLVQVLQNRVKEINDGIL